MNIKLLGVFTFLEICPRNLFAKLQEATSSFGMLSCMSALMDFHDEPSGVTAPNGAWRLIKETGAWHFVLPRQPSRRSGPTAAISWGFVREGNIQHVRPKAFQYKQERTNQHVFLTFWRRNFFLILAHPVYKM